MNLARALDAALPDIPVRKIRKSAPRLHPKLIAKEQVENGKVVYAIYLRGTGNYFRFQPHEWELLQLFDGERSYEQISADFKEMTGLDFSVEELRDFAESTDFWYKTPAEQNIAYTQKLADNRAHHVKKKSKVGDLSMIDLVYWDPDRFFGRFHERVKWIYSRWFTILTLCLFAFMIWVFIDRWGEIWHDTLGYYNFTNKDFYDILEFELLFGILAALHESAHGLTCKHYGGEVHRMGMLLIYLSPAFFVDVVEAWIYATKWQRVMTMLAGLWVELILCGVMTVVWWGTATGTFVHEIAYKFMLIGGVAVVIINMNPLIKMDGYHIFSEIIGMPDLKEASTAYVSSWIRKNLLRLPVTVPFIPKRRRVFFLVYALLSAFYAYGLLYFVVEITYNIFHHFTPDWAFIPATYVAYKVFKSRIFNMLKVTKLVYLDKKDRWRQWLSNPLIGVPAGAAVLVLLFAPIWKESVEGRFLLEPGQRAVIRAEVPGQITQVFAEEGQSVQAGATIARMRNFAIESENAKAQADLRVATSRATEAHLQYADYGNAENQRRSLETRARSLADEQRKLTLVSPVSGVVLTPRTRNLASSTVAAGTTVLEIADLSHMRARIYVAEPEMRYVGLKSEARLKMDGLVQPVSGEVSAISVNAGQVAAGVMPAQKYEAAHTIPFYVADVTVGNPAGALRDGMTGTAKIYGPRRSLAMRGFQIVANFAGRKLW